MGGQIGPANTLAPPDRRPGRSLPLREPDPPAL